MSTTTETLFSLPFNRSILVKADGHHRTSSDAGVLLMRSVLERTGLLDFLTDRLHDPRNPDRITYPLGELLLQGQLQLIQGWEGLWSEPLRTDPVFGAATSLQRGDGVVDSDRRRASQSSLSRLLGILGLPENRAILEVALQKLSIEHLRVRNAGHRLEEVVIDVDAMPIQAHGKQAGGAYNGHYKETIFLPLFATCAESGDVLGAQLRPGTQRETTGCEDFIVSQYHAVKKHASDRVLIRMDAGFNSAALYTRLEHEGIAYLMRLKKNPVLENMAAPYLIHRSSEKTYHELDYQAKSWDRPRRVILVVRPRPTELFDHFYFLITNLDSTQSTGEEVATTYSRRGKAEMHQGEIKAACNLSLSSSPRPKSHYRQNPIEREQPIHDDADAVPIHPENIVRLHLYLLTYQLLHIARELFHGPPPPMEATSDEDPQTPRHWSVDAPMLSEPAFNESTEAPMDSLPNSQARASLAPMEATPDEDPQTSRRWSVDDPMLSEPAFNESTEAPMDSLPNSQAHASLAPMESETSRLHLHCFRLYLLKIGATLTRHGRYVTVSIAKSAVLAWQRFWEHFHQFRWHTVPEF